MQKRKCCLPLLTHTIDQMTNVGVVIAVYLLYETELDKTDSNCETINALSLLILSIISLWICRILSRVDVSIYFQIGSKIRLLLHLFDLELFRAIWIFKAFPQTLIQFYVTKTNKINVLDIVFSCFVIMVNY